MTGGLYSLTVQQGQTYLLRLINAALNYQLFFKVGGHAFAVVAVDALLHRPLRHGRQTVDALMHANAAPGRRYYMAAQVYQSINNATYTATTTALLRYYSESLPPPPPAADKSLVAPSMPAFNDSATAQGFYGSLTGLLQDGKPRVPLHVDTRMLVTYGLGIAACMPTQTVCNRTRGSVAASMNNVSFLLPTRMSLLEAHSAHMRSEAEPRRACTPDKPPTMFDFTSDSINTDRTLGPLMFTSKGAKVKTVRFNSTVEVVLQNTAILGSENHPLHLHGFNFFVLAQGTGNFNAHRAVRTYNLVNPQQHNTVAVPAVGWAVIRFTADNPGVWIMLRVGHGVRGGGRPDSRHQPSPAGVREPAAAGGACRFLSYW